MKKVLPLLFICLSLFSTITEAQNLAVEGNQWNIRYYSSIIFYGVESYILHLEGDTLINGINYKKIYRSDDSLQVSSYPTNSFIREVHPGQVYLKQGIQPEFLLYDFSMELLDEITISIYGSLDCTLKVTAIDSVILNNGEPRKRMAIESADNSDWGITDYWIEGIGSTTSGLLNYYIQFCLTDYLESFLCHFQNEELLYPPYVSSCFVVPTQEITPVDPISIYPTPFSNQFNIDIEGNEHLLDSYKIYDLNGQQVMEGKIDQANNTINASYLPSGMYLLSVITVDGMIANKRLVKI
jgi:hypothetical protein